MSIRIIFVSLQKFYSMKYNIEIVKQKLQTENNSLKEICRELNYPYVYISRLLVKQGIDSTKRKHLMKINEDLIREIHKKHKEGYTITELSNVYKICPPSIIRSFEVLKLDYKYEYINRNINNNFFKVIDTEEKAYLLGFHAADGTINRNDNGMVLLIQERDKEILDYFKNAFWITKDYYKYPSKKETHQNRLKLIINSKVNQQNLINLGFPYDKTHNMFALPIEIMPKELYRHFIRGYFDGDGSIILPTKNSRVTKFKITSTNVDFLLFCKEEFEKIGCYNIKIEHRTNNLAKNLYIQNKPSIYLIYKYFYENCNFCLKRKYEKMNFVAQQERNLL